MEKPANFFYAVRRGRCPGVYNTYSECKQQIEGYSNAIFRKFPTLEEAEAFVKNQPLIRPTSTVSQPDDKYVHVWLIGDPHKLLYAPYFGVQHPWNKTYPSPSASTTATHLGLYAALQALRIVAQNTRSPKVLVFHCRTRYLQEALGNQFILWSQLPRYEKTNEKHHDIYLAIDLQVKNASVTFTSLIDPNNQAWDEIDALFK